jgi:hypothetical protein
MQSSLKAFPYPVLGRGDDYTDSQFQSTIDTRKQVDGDSEHVVLDYSFMISAPEIQALIRTGKARFAIDVRCSETLYRNVFFCDARGAIDFEEGQLYGKVTFSPIVVVISNVPKFTATDMNEEYQGASFELVPGDVVAVDDAQIRYVEFDKLQFESLVKVQTSEDIPDETYQFDLDSDVITILMGKKFRNLWEICREEKDKAPFLAMSVYKDCIHAALEYTIKAEDAEERKWVRALRLKLQTVGRKISETADFNELGTHAQQLVSKFGVARLLRNV